MFSQKTVWALVYLLVAVSEGGATLNVTGKMDNLLMDFVLDELRNYLLVNKDTIIAIPPISSDFEYDLVGIPVTGWFNTSKGSFTNPATIRRIGNVTTTHSRGKVVTSMMVGFSQLKVSFPEYLATVAGISESGYIDVMIQKNGVFIEVMVLFIPHCIVSISKFELRRMGGIIVDMNGLGLLSSLEGQIVAWILQSYRTSFTRVVENAVKNKLQDLMAKTKICKFKKPY